jgi:hypothetical protein
MKGTFIMDITTIIYAIDVLDENGTDIQRVTKLDGDNNKVTFKFWLDLDLQNYAVDDTEVSVRATAWYTGTAVIKNIDFETGDVTFDQAIDFNYATVWSDIADVKSVEDAIEADIKNNVNIMIPDFQFKIVLA